MQEQHLTKAILLKALHRHLRNPIIEREIDPHLPPTIHIPINESQAFCTNFFQDITMLKSSIFDHVAVDQLNHLNKPKISQKDVVPLCSILNDLNRYSEVDYFPQHFVMRQKIKTAEQLMDLSTWLCLYCNICHRFYSWEHPKHQQSRKNKRNIIKQQSIDLVSALGRISVISPTMCPEQSQCTQFHRQTLIKQIKQKQVSVEYFKIYKRALWKKDKVAQQLTKYKAVITDINVCMLRTIIWPGFTTTPYDPTCLELYFIIRSLLNQGPLSLIWLDVEMKKTQKNNEECRIYRGPTQINPFVISKSQVCSGAGLFTTQNIQKNKQIGEYLGELVRIGQRKTNTRLDYLQKINLSSFSFQLNQSIDIDASFYGNYTRLINHMPDGYQNCAFIKSDRDVVVIATRDIEAGQQIFVDYGSTYKQPWKEIFDKDIRRLGSSVRWRLSKNQSVPTIIELQY